MPIIEQGRHTYIVGGLNNHFDVDVYIGSFCSIAHGVTIIGGQHHRGASTFPFNELWKEESYPLGGKGRPVSIGHDVWIGMNAAIMEGVIIGTGAIIGAYAVVTNDVPPYGIAVGNKAQVVKYRLRYEHQKALMKIAWWDWPDEKIKEYMPFMGDTEKFIEECRKRGDL